MVCTSPPQPEGQQSKSPCSGRWQRSSLCQPLPRMGRVKGVSLILAYQHNADEYPIGHSSQDPPSPKPLKLFKTLQRFWQALPLRSMPTPFPSPSSPPSHSPTDKHPLSSSAPKRLATREPWAAAAPPGLTCPQAPAPFKTFKLILERKEGRKRERERGRNIDLESGVPGLPGVDYSPATPRRGGTCHPPGAQVSGKGGYPAPSSRTPNL